MATANKRHQARNEQALQDLLRTVAGNDRCADCQERNPGWASWSLGIFLCVRCGSLHRKLGTHISKVKSLSMDSWTAEQVENMRRVGNAASNQKYNPKNTKPPVPLDADEIDASMERFIRAKYEQKAYVAGAPQPTRTQTMPAPTSQPEQHSYLREPEPMLPAEDEQPQTPPAKSGRKFGFSFRSSKNKNKNRPEPVRSMSGGAAPGKVIGATFGLTDEGMEWKLVQLKEMGFPDEKRNSSVLKGVNGDLERAIESLVRLGEGTGVVQRPLDGAPEVGATNRSTFPQRPNQDSGFGAAVQSKPQAPARSQTGSSTPSQSHSQNFWDSLGPTSAPLPSSQAIESAFQNMQLNQGSQQPQQQSQQQQHQQPQPQAAPPPLFPNSTGGTPQQHYSQGMQSPYQQSMTPPMPQMPQQFANNPYSPSATRNPFMASLAQQSPVASANPFMNMQQNPGSPNPFLAQAPAVNGASFGQNQQFQPAFQQQQQAPQPQAPPPQQQQQQQPLWTPQPVQLPGAFNAQQPLGIFQQMPMPQQQQQMPQQNGAQMGWNPYQQQQQPQQQPQQPFFAHQQQQPMMPQATGRIDKSGIMALFNSPQMTPQPSPTQQQQLRDGSSTPDAQPVQSPLGFLPVQRSVTMPISGSKNPFSGSMSPPASAGAFGADDSGRHSPDAFASLSARYVR